MAVETDEPVYPAGTQYGDFTGTVAADGHGGVTLFELAKEVGLDLERYDLLSRGLKRLDVQLLSSYLPEGVPLRRTLRDDLNYSGD